MTPRLTIRRKIYRGKLGWLICGTDAKGRKPSVFTESRASAVVIREALRQGREITAEMFRIPDRRIV